MFSLYTKVPSGDAGFRRFIDFLSATGEALDPLTAACDPLSFGRKRGTSVKNLIARRPKPMFRVQLNLAGLEIPRGRVAQRREGDNVHQCLAGRAQRLW